MFESRLPNMKSSVYTCPDQIKNFKLRVKLKKIHSSQHDLDLTSAENECQIFNWQQKIFNRFEYNYYSDINNCVTDLEKRYHDSIPKSKSSRLFSYIHEDDFCQNVENVTTDLNAKMTKLCQELSSLKLRKDKEKLKTIEYNLEESLIKSQTKPFPNVSYEIMYIMADLSTSETHSTSLKAEYVLCCIKYDATNKLLWMYPDYSRNTEPYRLEVDVDGKSIYEYSIENICVEKSRESVENDSKILQKINARNFETKPGFLGTSFLTPKKNVLRVLFILEILTAQCFENNNIYVQYNIELPNNWSSLDERSLFGTTQTSRVNTDDDTANFGFYTELVLEYQICDKEIEDLSDLPCVYFQIISRDYWDRYRCEGLCYKHIPVFQPGVHDCRLHGFRVCPKGVAGALRRHFIGDYSNIDDLLWLRIPKEHEGNTINKFGVSTIGTGIMDVRFNVLNQTRGLQVRKLVELEHNALDRVGSGSLGKSVSEVLIAFRRARKRMLQARKNVLNIE